MDRVVSRAQEYRGRDRVGSESSQRRVLERCRAQARGVGSEAKCLLYECEDMSSDL